MTQHIDLQPTSGTPTPLAARLLYLVHSLQQVKEEAAALKGVFVAVREPTIPGGDNDYTSLAAELGISEAEALTVYDLVANIQLPNDCLNSADLNYLLTRLG